MTISPNVVILIRRVCMNDGLDDILYYMHRIKYIKTFMQDIFEQCFWYDLLSDWFNCVTFSVKLQCTKSHHILSQYYFSKSQHHWHGIFNVALLLMKIVNVEDTFSKTWKCLLSLVTLHSKCFYWCHIILNTIKTLLHYVLSNSTRR